MPHLSTRGVFPNQIRCTDPAEIFGEKWEIFDSMERAVSFNKLERERDGQNAQHCKEEIFTEKSEKTLADFCEKLRRHLLTSIQISVAVHTSGSVFVERVERAKRTRLELELIKALECLTDGYRN